MALQLKSKDEVFEAISNVKIRMQWDKVFAEFKVVETNSEDQSEVLYMLLKVIIIIKFVLKSHLQFLWMIETLYKNVKYGRTSQIPILRYYTSKV